MSQSNKNTPKEDVRRGGLRAILFGILMGFFGLAFGSAVAQGPAAVYFSALVYFACGLGMYFKVSRLAAVLALGLFVSGIVTFLVYLSQSDSSMHVLNSWNGMTFMMTFMMAMFFGGSLIAGVRGAFSFHRGIKLGLGGVGSTSI
jgi:peptidoglycan/LPS O-acetylase OafA/YrhL